MRYRRVQIDAAAYELPPEAVTSADLEARLRPALQALFVGPGQIEALTGVAERRWWPAGASLSAGATAAAIKALSSCEVPPDAVEVLVWGGVCREEYEPATACHVAAALADAGMAIAPTAAVYDLSNACLGVMNGMVDIANRIELGQVRAGMVVSCESARDIVGRTIDRLVAAPGMELLKVSLATMTGGSGAVAVVLSDGSFGGDGHPLLGGVVRADPAHHMLCRWGVEDDGAGALQPFMRTDAVAVLEHGVALGLRTWRAFLAELGWRPDEVDRTVCHQVGRGHRDAILPALGVAAERDFITYERLGNQGTVALPTALAMAAEQGFLTPGDRVALLGIGSGLNCLMLGVRW